MRIEAFAFRRTVASLAPPFSMPFQALANIIIDRSKRFPGIAQSIVVRPALQLGVDFSDQLPKWLKAIPRSGCFLQLVALPLQRFPGGKQVPIAVRTPLQIPVIAKSQIS